MTTRTGTTRKAPWAVFLTALLAVFAVVLGSLMIAAPANAKNDPDKTPPGHSAEFTPPGQDDVLPPGQDDNFIPPGQLDDDDDPNNDAKKVWICHADVNNGQGNTNLGVEGANGNGTGGEFGIGFNLIYISKAAAQNAHFKLHPNDVYALNNGTSFYCPGAPDTLHGSVCVANGDGTFGTVTFAYVEGKDITTGVSDPGGTPYANYTVVDAVNCQTVPVRDSATRCAVLATGGDYATVTFSGTKGTDIATWKSDPGDTPYTAYLIDESGVQCLTPEQATALDAAVAAAVPQPATVAAPAPAKVTVPAKGPVVPATVPAGDGSSVPTLPVTALALLVLGATTLAASTVRLAGAKR